MIHTIRTLPILTLFDLIKSNNKYLLLKKYSRYNFINKIRVWLFKIDLDTCLEDILKGYRTNEDDIKVKKIESLKNKIDILKAKYQAVMVILEVLKYGSDDDMLRELKTYGYEIRGNNYKQGLIQVYKQVENLKNKIDITVEELNEYLKSDGEGDEIKIEKVVASVLVGLELSLKINELTVIEFVTYREILKEKIKQQQKTKS